jgi:hypothetical protein
MAQAQDGPPTHPAGLPITRQAHASNGSSPGLRTRGLRYEGPKGNHLVVAMAFVALVVLSLLIVAVASWLEGSDIWRQPIEWLGTLDQGAALSLLSGSAQVIAGILAILITVVAIVLELSATRYTHRVTELFVRDPVNRAVMIFFVLTAVLCIGLASVLSGEVGSAPVVPRGGFLLAMAMMIVSMIALLPYFVYVFNFVSPICVIARIRADALKHVRLAGRTPLRSKRAVIDAIEEIEDVARGAMKNNDRGIAIAAVGSLATLLAEVTSMRKELPATWGQVDDVIAQDPDFVALAPIALAEIVRNQSWFESKVLRQYLNLFGESVTVARDVASMIAILTRQLGVAFAAWPGFLELCQRAFHSYLRTSINGRDPRTAYFVLHQYRLLAEELLGTQFRPAVLEVARRIRFYGELADQSGLPFLMEVAAYDLAQLVETAAEDPSMRDAILEIVLAMDRGASAHLCGVRRAEIQLATFFLLREDAAPATRIAMELACEPESLLEAARADIEQETAPDYWEITDRGANFSFLAPERRVRLEQLFQMIDDIRAARKQGPSR